ncbi:orotidine 5'-phosphate decarboxylase [Oceanobacillus caeni]|uniref:3-hexulose-6-phosphate synthase n=1 Tax=Oceanobacillus caeni TaxID=405946 RepID=A0ABR5MH66_9BACI|nr:MULTISPECIES: 3-hexulose-6-phosphate synthase [Bacillaceae]KKE77876.1 Fe-S cluster assembly protein HesB [Bacilli bacterium VT-13-104]PZD85590.1 Fe-S cluster assembly protein HesB [Bacilli bacterium]KPH72649.1 Fe-S cluster assembly protein HesB [Oceanobacillus caeni]MBU8791732.1 orotidine 5'-phosphate decarboxylase [Oceanobacillus caeni]MCR1834569.1 orotidine 5'-phosphate decarboxylase [Oceanobacillus caeni]
MKLQLALDRLTKEQCFQLVTDTKESIDIIEIGTGVIKEYGMSIVRDMREQFPDKEILADMKTCDAGKHETLQAFDAGADITTVMAFSAIPTIKDTLNVAKEMDKRIMIDLLECHSKDRIRELENIGTDLVSLHVGKDKQTEGTFNTELFTLVNGFNFEVAVAGGINLDTIPEIVKEKPDIIIVGSAITKAEDPAKVAKEMRQMLV